MLTIDLQRLRGSVERHFRPRCMLLTSDGSMSFGLKATLLCNLLLTLGSGVGLWNLDFYFNGPDWFRSSAPNPYLVTMAFGIQSLAYFKILSCYKCYLTSHSYLVSTVICILSFFSLFTMHFGFVAFSLLSAIYLSASWRRLVRVKASTTFSTRRLITGPTDHIGLD